LFFHTRQVLLPRQSSKGPILLLLVPLLLRVSKAVKGIVVGLLLLILLLLLLLMLLLVLLMILLLLVLGWHALRVLLLPSIRLLLLIIIGTVAADGRTGRGGHTQKVVVRMLLGSTVRSTHVE
jgi:hypothetical protein